ncbi:NACHT domain-containing protein, partial [Streptomyces massasporeus]
DWTGQSSANSAWAVSPRGLAGSGGDIAQAFERVPTHRLVILGEPGAGKTVLLIRLLLALLQRRPPGDPVPVLFPLASWDPGRQDLNAWMADQLAQDHPALRTLVASTSPRRGNDSQARALINSRLILPILDGLDELPQAVRTRAMHAINQVLPASHPLVLSSRTVEYRGALTTPAGFTVLLNGAAGVRLLPLEPTKAAAYLERDAGGHRTEAAARWERVTASLSTDSPAAQALSTPLGLFLARTIYNPRPDEHLTDLAHPSELLDQARFPTRQDIDTHLFAAFIPAAYRPHPHHPIHWTAQQAQRTLSFLAGHVQHTLDGTPNLAWWQLPKALEHRQELAVGLTVALMGWLPACILIWLAWGFAAGLTCWVISGLLWTVAATLLAASARERKPSSGIRWSWRGRPWLTAGLAFGLIFGLLFWLAFQDWGLEEFTFALAGGLPFGLMGGLRSVHPDLSKAVGPGVVLAQDRRTLIVFTLAGVLAGGLASTLTLACDLWFGYMPVVLPRYGVGFSIGLPVGLTLGFVRSVWIEYLVALIRLAVMRRVPWCFISFLADAHERRGVLRQVGAVYQFRHIDLQRHLARHQP